MRAGIFRSFLVLSVACLGLATCGGDSPIQPSPVCTASIAPGNATVPPEGGSGNVTVAIEANCPWTATASASWISITAGGSGNGPGAVAYSVAANPSTDARTGTIGIGGQTHTITQQGRAPTVCTYEISPPSADVGPGGASGSFAVTAPGDCTWTAASNAPWLVASDVAQRSGNGTVSYTVERNSDVTDRSAGISVADRTFTVRQGGDQSACQYSVGPVDFGPCMPAGSVASTLTTQAGCSWTVTPNVPWLSIPSGTSGTGSTTITIAFPDNYDAPRDGIAMVRWAAPTAGQNIRIAQAGCTYVVTETAFNFTAAVATGSFNVFQQSLPMTCGGATQDRCIWSAVSDVPWITISGTMPRAGDDRVAFTVASNETATPRVGRITVRDKVVVINQTGR